MPSLVEEYAFSCLSRVRPEWCRRADGESASIPGGREGQTTERCSRQLWAPSEWPSTQVFQEHEVSYLCVLHKDYSVYSVAPPIP